ncbi:hypothetical protein FACS1894103_6040 [Campylobacterota bacterium]|nr:hypothetical protein FACS1894103_6040 [Campylobacterota bacterium]
MIEVKDNLNVKLEEVRILYALIEQVSSEPLNIAKTTILKSSLVLLLYNIIEGTVYLVLEKIHENISSVSYNTMSDRVKKIYAEYYFAFSSKNTHKDHLDKTINNAINFPSLLDYKRNIKLFSGNHDVCKIREICKKYGICSPKITKTESEKILYIKDRRNRLAHGEISFKEACRELSASELSMLIDSTFNCMHELTNNAADYLSKKQYIGTSHDPL